MKIVFLDQASVDRQDTNLSALHACAEEYIAYDNSSPNNCLERIKDADVVISNKVLLDETILSQTNHLKLICVAATGTNNIDLQAAKQFEIAVCNARAYATPSVVQHVFALITQLNTNLQQYELAVKRGDWQKSEFFCLLDYPIHELSNKNFGIIGYGELGQAVANAARAFGMNVKVAKSFVHAETAKDRLSIDELLATSDIISLHCPLSEFTRHLLSQEKLDLLAPHALLINTARGGIVDEKALAKKLIHREIGGAGFDVLSVEPPTNDNILLNLNLPNFILTPHIAWASRESRQRLIDEIVLNIQAFQHGGLRNQVN
ncbi:MAG: D-2-hydroxyacid dehydrogenase [Gammaproteobacteria bacterium]|nr:D-2-hydroxyacid dehydrogenase [Gammaproteobacteria bacterium]MDH5728024.1 D-2-hydroxyacid dehydrogenase [Gammaproteobacteria bacterium]